MPDRGYGHTVHVRVLVLGSLEVVGTANAVPRGDVARRVLAVLAANANRPISADRLADLVWPGSSRHGGNSLQAHISRWRKVLGADRISYAPAGYTLTLGSGELDAFGFEQLAAEALSGRGTTDPTSVVAVCDAALDLWRGTAFEGFEDHEGVVARRSELELLRSEVALARLELLCDAGDFETALAAAAAAAVDEPWSEPIHRILARAHYGRGDQVAALEVLTDLGVRLRNDLGLDLSVPSQLLREQILRQEPALDPVATTSVRTAVSAERISGRLDELPTATQAVLRAAAVAGTDLDTALVGAVLDIGGPALADALAPALRAGIVLRTEAGVRFVNHQVHEAVAALVPAGEALDLHRRLGEGLLRRRAPGASSRAAEHLAAAAALGSGTALRATELDHELACRALAAGQPREAAHHARRSLISLTHVAGEDLDRIDSSRLRLTLAQALHRSGDLRSALEQYAMAAESPDVTDDVLIEAADAYEECSLHARRHRTGPSDRSILLLDAALQVAGADDAGAVRIDLLASQAQALMFAGLHARAAQQGDRAVAEARRLGSPEVLARTLLRRLAVHRPDGGAVERLELAREAAELSREAGAEELELEALCAWVPELMRVDRIEQAEDVIADVERLALAEANVVHRYKVPMWRAAMALRSGRYDEADVLIADFAELGHRDGYEGTDRVRGFQSILVALGQGRTDRARDILAEFDHDQEFEPWRAARLVVADAGDDGETVRDLLVPWSARRFTLSQPFADVQTFCACLIGEVVARHGDSVARQRLAAVVEPGVGQNQVLGSGAAILGDAADVLKILEC